MRHLDELRQDLLQAALAATFSRTAPEQVLDNLASALGGVREARQTGEGATEAIHRAESALTAWCRWRERA